MHKNLHVDSSPHDWKVWLPRAFWLDWSDPKIWQNRFFDPTVWLPVAFLPEKQEHIRMLFKAIQDDVGTINASNTMIDAFNAMLDAGQRITQAISVYAGTNPLDTTRNSSLTNKPSIQMPAVLTTQILEVKNALSQIAEFINNSDDPSAVALFDRFSQELSKPTPEKLILRQMWEGIEKVLPSVTSLSEAVSQILYLINARTR